MKHLNSCLLAAFFASAGTLLQAQRLDPSAQLLISRQLRPTPAVSNDQAKSSLMTLYVQYEEASTDWEAIRALGGHVGVRAGGLATISLPAEHLSALAEVKGIRYIQAPQPAQPMLDLARAEAHADDVQHFTHPLTGEETGFSGAGIVIGQVDAGLDYMHNAFKSADGTLRIKRVWEQGTDPVTAPIAGLSSPEAFGYGAEFDTPELILAAGGDSDAGSHGTHVMGIAAGSDNYLNGQFHGLAPEAELVMVAISDVGADNSRISDAIKYIFDYADSVHKPCVINLSLGSHSGPHDGTSPFDQIADALQGPGRLIVGAAGNYGQDKFHISRDFSEDSSPLQTLLNFKYGISSADHGEVELWCDPNLPLRLEVFSYNVFSGAESDVTTYMIPDELGTEVREFSLGRNVTGKMQIVGDQNPFNGKSHIVLRSYITNLRKNYYVGIRLSVDEGQSLPDSGQLDLWADDSIIDFNAPEQEGFINSTTESTITEIGGTAHRILSVGAYTTRDKFLLEGSTDYLPVGMELYDLSDFSGFGPTADGRQKPEVCAPGSFIVSSVSGHDVTSIYMHSHYIDASGHPQRYGYLQGTSMSAPFVTGAVALWLQAYPELSPEQLKEVITASTRLDNFTLDSRYWGAGKIDVQAGLEKCIELSQGLSIRQLPTDAAEDCRYYDLTGKLLQSLPAHGIFLLRQGNQMRKVVIP